MAKNLEKDGAASTFFHSNEWQKQILVAVMQTSACKPLPEFPQIKATFGKHLSGLARI